VAMADERRPLVSNQVPTYDLSQPATRSINLDELETIEQLAEEEEDSTEISSLLSSNEEQIISPNPLSKKRRRKPKSEQWVHIPGLNLTDLPDELLYKIATLLPFSNIGRIASICTRFKDIADDLHLWTEMVCLSFFLIGSPLMLLL